MMGEIRSVLDSENYGEPVHKVLKYISADDFRVGAIATEHNCECHKDKKRHKEWLGKMKHIYE